MKSVFLLLLVSTSALADDAALLRCRAIADGPARLACYDALPLGMAAAKAGAPTAPALAPSQQFGLEQKSAEAAVQAIESHIPGRFEGWSAKSRITLANGQVWEIADDSKAFMNAENPKVRVRRGAMGAFYIEIEKTNRSPRVKRVQ